MNKKNITVNIKTTLNKYIYLTNLNIPNTKNKTKENFLTKKNGKAGRVNILVSSGIVTEENKMKLISKTYSAVINV